MANVYISYQIKDKVLAQDVSTRLKGAGHQISIDTEAIIPGQEWRAVLRDALENADCVVTLITANTQSSRFVMMEIGATQTLRKPLIPLVFDDGEILSVISHIYCIQQSGRDLDVLVQELDKAIKALANRNVFIVHGHDEAKRLELKNFLSGLGVNAITLLEEDSLGKTIIEKFEHYAAKANFAFVLMTPDDLQVASGSDTASKWRTRQNVIMELGWFMAKLGRHRVIILYKGELEIPSDILGVVYCKFNNSVLEVSEDIRKALKRVGLIT